MRLLLLVSELPPLVRSLIVKDEGVRFDAGFRRELNVRSYPSRSVPELRDPLREVGHERRAVDAIFRACPVEVWPDYSQPTMLGPSSLAAAGPRTL